MEHLGPVDRAPRPVLAPDLVHHQRVRVQLRIPSPRRGVVEQRRRVPGGRDLLHPVAAVSVGIVNQTPLLDLCYTEDVAATVDFNVVMNSAGDFIEVQGSGEEATFSETELAEMLRLAKAGIRQLIAAQEEATKAAEAAADR